MVDNLSMSTTENKGTEMNYKVGDKVTPVVSDRVPMETIGRIFTVVKINPKNLKCSADDGGRGINFPADILLPATDENVSASKRSFGTAYETREFFANGDVVTLASGYKDITTSTPLVVTKDDGGRYVNLVKLGGDGSRYLRMPPKSLIKRNMEWLAEELINNA